jgi:serine/threonine protein kinase/Flp pilus assembly protein TadD
MTPERYQQIDRLFRLALERPAVDRSAFVVNTCAGDEELRAEVQSLLRFHDEPMTLLDEAPSPLAADLISAVGESPNLAPPPQRLGEGTAVGRYIIVREVGGGGMGFVYLARDPELNRKVAIKLLRAERSPDWKEGRERLLREAQAMAQLAHPNVISVYDVGTYAQEVFIAMEYVDGSTLTEWLSATKRSWRETVSIFAQAGRGLAAAHAAGILHRDFKPDNVLVGNDARVRVLDFGLARAAQGADGADSGISSDDANAEKIRPVGARMLSVALTKSGKLMGTPAYMAPEQLIGERGDARTDQFSFCVALYQGLYGELPFSGETVAALLDQIEQQRVKEPSKAVRVPARVRKVVLRGLNRAREARYESIDDLLRELTQRPRAVWRWSVGALIVLAAVLAFGSFRRERLNKDQFRAIAVLPLENLSHDPQQEYLADGLTDELITNLSKVGSLRVIARSSVLRYKSQPRSIPEIARDLKVDGVLEGTVLPSGDRVRIAAQFIDASTGQNIWAESYEGGLGDVLALQNHVARAILGGIRAKLTAQEEQRLAIAQPVDSDAYLAYLRGLFYWEQGWRKGDVNTAIRMFEQATTLDPKFALAYYRLALAYGFSHAYFDASRETTEKASAAAERSLSLDPNLAEAYLARGYVAAMRRFPVEAVVQDFQRALTLSPNLPDAHWRLGASYLHIGFLDEALSELNKVLALDPHNFRARYYIARTHLYQQRYDEAFLDYERSPDFPPQQLWEKVLILSYRGERTGALELINELRRKLPESEDVASTYAVLLAADGKTEQAEEQIRLAIRTGEGRAHFHYAEYNIASAYALMGDRREALHWLRRTAEHRLTPYPLFERDPNLDNLRGDPDFKTWLGEMKSLWERRRASLVAGR